MPPERVADFAAKYGHLGLHWMQVGAQNADGLCYYDIVRGGMDKGVGLADLCKKMGLTLADAVSVGDSANDVPQGQPVAQDEAGGTLGRCAGGLDRKMMTRL